MTLGDIIQKILGLFGVAPARQRQLVARIDSVKQKIAEMEENRNTIMRANKAEVFSVDMLTQASADLNSYDEDMGGHAMVVLEPPAPQPRDISFQSA